MHQNTIIFNSASPLFNSRIFTSNPLPPDYVNLILPGDD